MLYRRTVPGSKTINRVNIGVVLVLLILFLAGMTLYLLPYVSYYRMERAIAKRNANELISYINKSELRKNLLNARDVVIRPSVTTSHFPTSSLVDLAMKWVMAGVHDDPDRFLTVENTYAFLTEVGKNGMVIDGVWPLIGYMMKHVSFRYHSLNEFSVSVKDRRGRFIGYVTFIFGRNGLHWQLCDVRFPLF